MDEAVTNALRNRADLARARKDTENAQTSLRLATNQKLPDVRVNASYQASGLGGTEVMRTGGFPGTIVGPGHGDQLRFDAQSAVPEQLPDVGHGCQRLVSASDRAAEEAIHARSVLEAQQAAHRVKTAEARAIQQVRDAGWKVEMNGRRVETARSSRELAEQRRDVEQKRFEVGMSTSFLVIQAQRDLAQAHAERALRGARVRPVARRFRGAPAGRPARPVVRIQPDADRGRDRRNAGRRHGDSQLGTAGSSIF